MEHAVELPAALNPLPAKPQLLEYYTDPLGPPSQAFEWHWQRLRVEFGHRFAGRLRLGGPAASYPACLAVKCAGQQGEPAEALYLLAVRTAARQGRDLTQAPVLTAVAEELAAQAPAVFDAAVFGRDMAAHAGAAALLDDAQQARHHHISAYPAIVVLRDTGPSKVLVGYRPYEALLQALAQLAPDLFYVPSLVDGGAG